MFITTPSVYYSRSSFAILRTALRRSVTSSKRRHSSCPPHPKIVSSNIATHRSELPFDPSAISIMASTNRNPDTAVVTDIEELHRRAILSKQSTYVDTSTGFTVFTELSHLKRGKCCGNMCRHCPYGYANVRGANQNDNGNGVAQSGDSEGTALLVRKIMDGTYYDCIEENNRSWPSTADRDKAHDAIIDNDALHEPLKGKGGRAGGTFTDKNVPYTRKGDTGTSQLFTGETRGKDDVLFEAMGTVDELCCIVGTVYAELVKDRNDATAGNNTSAYGELPEQLLDVMSRLFDVGSHIARPSKQPTPEGTLNNKKNSASFSSHHVDTLEEWIDTMTEQLPELTSFILPTGSPASASLHVARTVCRRAERRMVPLIRDDECCDSNSLAYVNRLSDYLFTAARYVNYCEGKDEVQYRREKGVRSRDVAGRERVVVRLKD